MQKTKLTRSTIDKLRPPAEGYVIVWDTDLPGFGLRITSANARTFIAQGRVNGRSVRKNIASASKKSPEEARKAAKKMLADFSEGVDPRDVKRAAEARKVAERVEAHRRRATLGALLEAYADFLEESGRATHKAVRAAVRRHVREAEPALWATQAHKIGMSDLVRIVGNVAGDGKLREAAKLRAYLRAAYAAAIQAHHNPNAPAALRELSIESNPARELGTVQGAEAARDKALSLAALRAYWKHVAKLDSPGGAALRFHLLTGAQRLEQLARLTVDDYDRDDALIVLRDIKGRRSVNKPRIHVVPLLPEAVSALEAMGGGGKDAPFLFTVSSGKYGAGYATVRGYLQEVLDDMGKADTLADGPFTLGDLRRTVETRLASAGVSQIVRAHLQSHGLGGVQARHYDRHDYLNEKRAALETLLQILTSAKAKVTPIAKARR